MRAYDPKISHLSDRRSRSLKEILLAWPLGKALIFSPSQISIEIRGSSEAHNKFLENLHSIIPQCLFRTEVNDCLGGRPPSSSRSADKQSDPEIPSPPFEPLSPNRSSTYDQRLDSLDSQVGAFSAQLLSIQQSLQTLSSAVLMRPREEVPPSSMISDASESGSDLRDGEIVSSEFPQNLWSAVSTSSQPCSFFNPMTVEKEPEIPNPFPTLSAQGIKCQRLGEAGWNRIRYVEAEKRLRRGGVFQPLSLNHQFSSASSNADADFRKTEKLLATASHALLAQLQAFNKTIQNLTLKCPKSEPYVKELFLETSEFRMISDDFLQFLCGKRAEVIEARRKDVEPSNRVLAQLI